MTKLILIASLLIPTVALAETPAKKDAPAAKDTKDAKDAKKKKVREAGRGVALFSASASWRFIHSITSS